MASTSTVPGRPAIGLTAADVAVKDLDNNSLIIRLHFTINHLSRWLTPVHDLVRMERSVRRGEPSVKELLLQLRDEELRVFPKMYLISIQNNPNLDKLPPFALSERQLEVDARNSAISVLGEFRRLRQSTCSLLRSMPDLAWERIGTSRLEHDWQLRKLAELLADHDLAVLAEIDLALDRNGARENVNEVSKAHLDELLRLVPVSVRKS